MNSKTTITAPPQKIFRPSHLTKILLVLCLVCPAVTLAATVGQPAPFFELEGVDNKTYQLNDFKDKIVFINFWASWCTPCRKELPMLDQLQDKFDNLIVLAINVDSERENADQFLKQHKIRSLVLYDPQTTVVSSYEAVAMPSSYILDQNGIVRYKHYGFNAKKDPVKWSQEVSSLLQKNK